MSANQTELRAVRYRRLLKWFGKQADLAPINAVHYAILWQIYDFLLHHADVWGSPDIQRLCVMGDSVVKLYDQPLDVVDLTRNDDMDEGNGQANDSGIVD